MTRPLTLLTLGVVVMLAGCSSHASTGGEPARKDSISGASMKKETSKSLLPAPGYEGYDGQVPSVVAQVALEQLQGKRFRPTNGQLGAEELVIEHFAVVPNPVTGKGPVILLVRPGAPESPLKLDAKQGEGGWFWIPIATDGDAADFVQRVTGTVPSNLSGPLSDDYAKTMAGP